jgi:uncharacterized protein (TIGR02996 family)
MRDPYLREAFVKKLEENEDDTTTRLIFADYLEENGEDEEAQRMRKWDAAKQWLLDAVASNEESYSDYDSDDAEAGSYWDEVYHIGYAQLIEFGHVGANAQGIARETARLNCGNNEHMSDFLNNHEDEFWENWSIVTGVPAPKNGKEKAWFGCAC